MCEETEMLLSMADTKKLKKLDYSIKKFLFHDKKDLLD
jgi:Fe-S cluster biosynthesis and repair protein YggX